MRIKIKRFDKSLPIPKYETEGAACVDLFARENTIIPSQELGYIPLNIALEIPKNCWALVAARGSTHKFGLLPVHGIGVGDWDFRGDGDEYVFPVYNFSKTKVRIKKGSRVAQLMILKYEKVEFEEVRRLGNKNRGKFGSTGSS